MNARRAASAAAREPAEDAPEPPKRRRIKALMEGRGKAAPDPEPASEPASGPCLIAIVGDSGSGKTTVAEAVASLLGPERVSELRLDDYHRYTREERTAKGLTALNPAVHDFALMEEHLRLLRAGRPIRNRSYNHSDGRFGPMRQIQPNEIVLVLGLLGFPNDDLLGLYDLSVFLAPEPDLLFRWKLRRDVQSRGYTEAEVLKNIVQHLLDAKEFVDPQAGRADVVVRYELPSADADDDEIRTSVRLRRGAAQVARGTNLIAGLGPAASQEECGDGYYIRLGNELTMEEVDRWAASIFPDSYVPGGVGEYLDDEGERHVRPPLACVEVLIARLAKEVRCPG